MSAEVISSDLDLLCDEAVRDPYAFYGRLREHDPVHWNARHRSWVLTRYEDVAAAFTDDRLTSDRVQSVFDEKLDDEERALRAPTFEVLAGWMVFKDPPDHTRLRKLVQAAFTPRAVQQLAPRISEIVDAVLDLPEAGAIDLVRDVAYPIPAMVIAEMLGVPPADRDLFKAWSNDISTLLFGGARDESDRAHAQAGLVGLDDYLRELLEDMRTSPGTNLMSALLRAHLDDDSLSEDEVVHTCILLLFAGHETTTNLIANAYLTLSRHPEQRELLMARPELIAGAVEELNRFDGPVRMTVRRAATSFELRGRAIGRGDRVLLCHSAANRDPRHFGDPDRLDLERTENRHIAFGLGIHYCLGASLARLETQIAILKILRRLDRATVATAEPEWLRLIIARGLRSLPVTYGDAHLPSVPG